MKNKFFLSIIISFAVLAFCGSWQDVDAGGEPAPISGTPLLREQKLQLLRDYGPPSPIKAELDRLGSIRMDVVGQPVTFWAYNFATGEDYQTAATCMDVFPLGTGFNLNIYKENTQNVGQDEILRLRTEFINKILPAETEWFGSPPLGDFTILILDIRDDYDPSSGSTTYVSGYYYSGNEFAGTPENPSNQRHMIYLDSSPGNPGSMTSFGTLAHEFQHFIHFHYDPYEEDWVEEGLSGLARFVCGYGHQASHVNAFGLAPTTSLTYWQGELANYGATYLFMLYLAEHSDPLTLTLTKNIVSNRGLGIEGINNALSLTGYTVRFNDIFKNWVVANYLNNPLVSNVYGYEASFNTPGIIYFPGNIQVSQIHATYPASGSGTINQYAADYVGFTGLGDTYDIFVFIPHNLSQSDPASYSYTGRLGSFLLSIDGLSSTTVASGVKEGSSSPTPAVLPTLSSENTISTGGSGGDSGGGDGGGGGCFIAATAFGSPLAPEVTTLREFRDRYLLTHLPGQAMVAFYYKVSPALADFLALHPSFRISTRLLLYPVVGMSRLMLDSPRGTKIAFLILLMVLSGVLIRIIMKPRLGAY